MNDGARRRGVVAGLTMLLTILALGAYASTVASELIMLAPSGSITSLLWNVPEPTTVGVVAVGSVCCAVEGLFATGAFTLPSRGDTR